MSSSPKPFLGLASGVGLVIANMVGAGVFLSAGFMAQDLTASQILWSWVVGAAIAMLGAGGARLQGPSDDQRERERQDDCGKDPSTAREIDACVEALDPFDEPEDAPPEAVESEKELPPEEPEPEDGDDLEPSLPDAQGD